MEHCSTLSATHPPDELPANPPVGLQLQGGAGQWPGSQLRQHFLSARVEWVRVESVSRSGDDGVDGFRA